MVDGGVQFRETVTDFSPGPLKKTGIPSDVALEGDGFFVVQKGQEKLLTRAGNFHLTSAGALVTQQGYPVLGEGNSPIAVNPGGEAWEIDSSGSVNQGTARQPLQIVKPASLGDLVKNGENLFRSLTNVQPVAAGRTGRRRRHPGDGGRAADDGNDHDDRDLAAHRSQRQRDEDPQ